MHKVGIIILSYNNFLDTINCIESVCCFSEIDKIKIIVADNGSNVKILNELEKYISEKFSGNSLVISDHVYKSYDILPLITLYKINVNLGYAVGNNKAAELLREDHDVKYLMILNNDVIFIDNIIRPLVSKLENVENIGIISPLLLKKDQSSIDLNCARKNSTIFDVFIELTYLRRIKYFKRILSKRYLIKENVSPNDLYIDLPSGSCMLMRKDLFFYIDGFDENTFLYYEENILYEKIREIGLRNLLCASSKAVHIGASSTSLERNHNVGMHSFNSAIYYLGKYKNASSLIIYYLKIRYFFWFKFKVLKVYINNF